MGKSAVVQTKSSPGAAVTSQIGYITFQQKRQRTINQSPLLYGHAVKRFSNDLTGETGYVQMDTVLPDIPCTDTERDSVVAFLLDGVYIE